MSVSCGIVQPTTTNLWAVYVYLLHIDSGAAARNSEKKKN